MGRIHSIVLLALITLVIAISIAAAQQGDRSFVIRDVRIFDGSRVIPKGTVVVQNGKITSLGDIGAIPSKAQVIDGGEYTLLPGLIDAHTHSGADDLKQSLVFGVTTVLDMFADYREVASIKQQASGKGQDMADMFSAGICVTAPKGHGTEYDLLIPTINGPEEAQAFVDARLAEGSDFIKIIYGSPTTSVAPNFPSISRATMAAVVTAAHRRGKLAVAHIGTQQDARDAIEVGVDGIVHCFVDRSPDPTFVRFVIEHGAFVIPTLSVRLRGCVGYTSETHLLQDSNAQVIQNPNITPYLSLRSIRNLNLISPQRPLRKCNVPFETIPQLKAAGVPILAGTDANNPGTAHGASLHSELNLLVRAGLTPTEALAAATSIPAARFRLADRGRIAPGLRADLLLVKGDPTVDIKATRNIERVWKLGIPLNRQPFATTIAQEKKEDESLRQLPAPVGSEAGLVSDFEAGKPAVQFGKGWSLWDDKAKGGKSNAEFKVIAGGAQQSMGALQIRGEVVARASAPVSGAIFYPGASQMQPVNLSLEKGLSFWAKGDGKPYRVLLFTKSGGIYPATQRFVANSEWRQFTYTFAQFDGMDGHDVTGIAFVAGPDPGQFSLQIDEVRLR